jgi:hypothetical protein
MGKCAAKQGVEQRKDGSCLPPASVLVSQGRRSAVVGACPPGAPAGARLAAEHTRCSGRCKGAL